MVPTRSTAPTAHTSSPTTATPETEPSVPPSVGSATFVHATPSGLCHATGWNPPRDGSGAPRWVPTATHPSPTASTPETSAGPSRPEASTADHERPSDEVYGLYLEDQLVVAEATATDREPAVPAVRETPEREELDAGLGRAAGHELPGLIRRVAGDDTLVAHQGDDDLLAVGADQHRMIRSRITLEHLRRPLATLLVGRCRRRRRRLDRRTAPREQEHHDDNDTATHDRSDAQTYQTVPTPAVTSGTSKF